MSHKFLTGINFLKMIEYGSSILGTYADQINDLNVFPVPDGDTGTNMSLTMRSGYQFSQEVNSEVVGEILPSFSRGLLMGARGNSGVILSQIFAGFSDALKSNETVNTEEFAHALKEGSSFAYKAVTDPVEGTILTVIRETADKAVEFSKVYNEFEPFLEKVSGVANESLDRTPESLPILKEAGVVDSGGKGLVVILEGFLKAILNEPLDHVVEHKIVIKQDKLPNEQAQQSTSNQEIIYGYCTEFMIQLDTSDKFFKESDLRNRLKQEGDSLVVVKNDDLVKVHLHTEYPGKSLNLAQEYGSLSHIKIDNMREQHAELVEDKQTDYAIITVSSGEGNAALFKELGVGEIIEGGQTMNPSIQSFLDKIQRVNAKNIIILPNNKNIILAAEEAQRLTEKNVTVLPTKSIQEGLSAMLAFDESSSIEDNVMQMQESLDYLTTGQVTKAVRSTTVSGIEITQGDFIGIKSGEIVVSAKDEYDSLLQLLQLMITEDTEILTILIGEDAKIDRVQIEAIIEKSFSDLEIEIHDGGQVVYPYLISIE